jgi:hypothetical protein
MRGLSPGAAGETSNLHEGNGLSGGEDSIFGGA